MALAPAGARHGGAPPEPLTLAEEAELLKYYGGRLQHICRELRLPRRVLGTAVTYLKRIYLALSCMEQDPQQLLLTCLYLACKVGCQCERSTTSLGLRV
jgi:cyclin H